MTDFPATASPAVQFVQEGQNRYLGFANDFLSQTQVYVNQLAHFTTTGTAFNVSFDFNGQLTPFQRPVQPAFNLDDLNLRDQEQPGLPSTFDAQTPDIGTLPEFNAQEPAMAFGPRPTRPNIATPQAPATPAAPVVPGVPNYAVYIPEPVTLQSLNLPVFPTLDLPVFTAARPSIQPFNIDQNWSFTPEAYVSALLAKIQARVSTWCDGQEALPLAIERALFDRGRGRVTIETQAEIDQVYDDFGARGFTAPPGMVNARVDGVRQKGQDRTAEFNRDATIKAFDEALANMRLAVQSGIQLEGMTINLHIEEQKLLLQSAQFLRETAIAVVQARIAQFTAEMQGYAIDAQVLETQLKAELAKLDEVRVRLDGEKLRGDINEQTTRQYLAQWEAVKALADFYRTQIDAVKVQADLNRIPIEIFSEQCKAFDSLMDAYGKDVDAYKASVDAEGSKAVMYGNLVQAFSARTSGVVQYGGLTLDRERLRIAEHGQNLQVYDASLRRLGLLLDAEKARLGAVGEKVSAQASIYRAQADVESAASAATDRSFQLGLEAAQARVNTQLETARIRTTENVALSGLILQALQALAQVSSQLTASSMSAVHYSASVSASDGYEHSRSVGWSGDAQDWDPSFV